MELVCKVKRKQVNRAGLRTKMISFRLFVPLLQYFNIPMTRYSISLCQRPFLA
jgi:hypothetical protein